MSTCVSAVIWRISDGRAGHDTQSTGLTEALRRRLDCRVMQIQAQPQSKAAMQLIAGTYPPGAELPPPALIIGAGHQCHLDMLAARRRYGGRAVVIMRPSLPYRWFDLCLIPEHDRPRLSGYMLTTKGALNNMRPGSNWPRQGLILIGGPSRHHHWDEAGIMQQVQQISRDDSGVHWTLTDSPRTPARTRRQIAQSLPAAAGYRPFRQCRAGWLAETLPETGAAWISEDSVSMIYEALSAGCRVGLLDVPRKTGSTRIARGIDTLIREGYVTPYKKWRQFPVLRPAPVLLQEADRCAAFVAERLLGLRT